MLPSPSTRRGDAACSARTCWPIPRMASISFCTCSCIACTAKARAHTQAAGRKQAPERHASRDGMYHAPLGWHTTGDNGRPAQPTLLSMRSASASRCMAATSVVMRCATLCVSSDTPAATCTDSRACRNREVMLACIGQGPMQLCFSAQTVMKAQQSTARLNAQMTGH